MRNFLIWEMNFKKNNDATYDLMDIFSQNMYFDLGFHGSSSIKKVLPIMVPGMKYDDLAVKNWWIAMQKLEHLINWKISDPVERLQTFLDQIDIENLDINDFGFTPFILLLLSFLSIALIVVYRPLSIIIILVLYLINIE